MHSNLTESKRKTIFLTVIAISFIAILIYNFLTPLMSDDLLFDTSTPYSLLNFIKEEYNNYMTWNGRVILQFIMHASLFLPKWIFNILNSGCFVLLMLLIYLNVEHRKKYDFVLYTLINLLVWIFGVSFDQTILWLGGACNYLWGMTIILGFVTFYRYQTVKATNIETQKHLICFTILMFVFGLLAGWCNENTSGGGLLLVLFFTIRYFLKKRSVKSWMYSGILGMCAGLAMMVMAPGNSVRGALMQNEEEHSGLLALVGRFLKINDAVSEHFFILLSVIVLLLVYFVLKGQQLKAFANVYAFLFVAFATSYVLIFTPQPMDRAHFGSGIFIIIALVQLVAYIPMEDLYISTLKYGSVIILAFYMFFSYCENGADLARIFREVQERDEYILEQKAQGNLNLTLPQIRPDFETKYSFIYLNDVSEDPEGWGNRLYRVYYKLDSVIGVPRDEWAE